MTFTISSKTLLDVTLAVGQGISRKNQVPILDYFLFEIDGDARKLTITASDLEIAITGTAGVICDGGQAPSFGVPASYLLDILKELDDVPLTCTGEVTEGRLDLSWGAGTASMPIVDGATYPRPSFQTDAQRILLPASIIRQGLVKAEMAVVEDLLRPVLGGINFNITPDALSLVGTDGHRLVVYEVHQELGVSQNFILPKRGAHIVGNLIKAAPSETEIGLLLDGRNACFVLGAYTVFCRVIEGHFPNYSAVIPKGHNHILMVSRRAFLSALKRVSVCAAKATNMIRLGVASDSLAIEGRDADFAISAQENIPCSYQGVAFEIGFKATYLMDILGLFEDDEVSIALGAPTQAAIIRPQTEQGDTAILTLLMPMIIS